MGPENEWYDEYARRLEQILAALVKGLPADDREPRPRPPARRRRARAAPASASCTSARSTASTRSSCRRPSSTSASATCTGPQEITGAVEDALRRARSIELDFGEQEQEKRVVVVRGAGRDGRSRIESVPLTAGRRLRDVAGTLDELRRSPDELGDDVPARDACRPTAPLPGLAEQVKELLPNALDVAVEHPRAAGRRRPSAGGRVAARARRSSSPTFYQHRNGASRPAELQKLFDGALRGGVAVRPLRLTVEGFTSFRERARAVDFSRPRPLRDHRPDRRRQVVADRRDRLRALRAGAARRRRLQAAHQPRRGAAVGAARLRRSATSAYRVARTVRRTGASQQRLERVTAAGAEAVADRAREIKAEVERILGLDYDGFTRSVVLPQGQFDAFLKGEPKERRKILVALLNLGVYERMQQLANTRATDARREAEFIRRQLDDRLRRRDAGGAGGAAGRARRRRGEGPIGRGGAEADRRGRRARADGPDRPPRGRVAPARRGGGGAER